MSENLRTFIAVELDDGVKERLREIQQQLQQLEGDVKWVEPGNIHITLRFLGELNPKRLKVVQHQFPTFLQNISSFRIAISGLGAFPNPHKPKVIWAGISDPDGRLSQLAEQIEDGLCRCGIGKDDKEFSPHITIGRTRSFKNLSRLAEAIPPYSISPAIEQIVRRVTLFKSTLTSQGPIYEPLQTLELISP